MLGVLNAGAVAEPTFSSLQLYEHPGDEITLGEVERIGICLQAPLQ